jgi:hypothetical protein
MIPFSDRDATVVLLANKFRRESPVKTVSIGQDTLILLYRQLGKILRDLHGDAFVLLWFEAAGAVNKNAPGFEQGHDFTQDGHLLLWHLPKIRWS